MAIKKIKLPGMTDAIDIGVSWNNIDNKPSITTYENKTAADGGTAESLVTTGEKYIWNNKGTYSKPSDGIPLTDLASQGTTNAGKFVVVGNDGKLTIAAINSAGGVSF